MGAEDHSKKQRTRYSHRRAALYGFGIAVLIWAVIILPSYFIYPDYSKEIPISAPWDVHPSGDLTYNGQSINNLKNFNTNPEDFKQAVLRDITQVDCDSEQPTNLGTVVQRSTTQKSNGQITTYSITVAGGYRDLALATYDPANEEHTCFWSKDGRYFRVTGVTSGSEYGGSNYEITNTKQFDYVYDLQTRVELSLRLEN
jgi:hypothetical protein